MASAEAPGGAAAPDGEMGRYLRNLTGYTIARLEAEPQQLKSQLEMLDNDIQRLATDNYDMFLEGADCLKFTKQTLDGMCGSLDEMIEELPKLNTKFENFGKEAEKINKSAKITRLMLANQYQLLEILEIPQLINSCARVGMYEEALGLESFVVALQERFPKVEVLEDIASQTRQTMKLVVWQLLKMLEGKVQLPVCLRVIGYLRRVGRFKEKNLREQFLESRDAWLNKALASIPEAENDYEFLTSYLDQTRSLLFEILHQYQAIFIDSTETSSGEDEGSGGLIAYWTFRHIQKLLHTLEAHLDKIDETAYIGNLFDHCMYCGLSLSRVGVDFRGLVGPIFEKRIINIFRAQIDEGKAVLSRCLSETNWFFEPKQLIKLGITLSSDLEPIASYPPLATLCNTAISALNSLRHCAILTVKLSVTQILRVWLMESLKQIAAAAATPMFYTEKERSGREIVGLVDAFVGNLVTFIRRKVVEVFHGESALIHNNTDTHDNNTSDSRQLILLTDEIKQIADSVREKQMERLRAAEAQEAAEREEKRNREQKAKEQMERRNLTKSLLSHLEKWLRESPLPPLNVEEMKQVYRKELAAAAAEPKQGLSREEFFKAVCESLPLIEDIVRQQLKKQLEQHHLKAAQQKDDNDADTKKQGKIQGKMLWTRQALPVKSILKALCSSSLLEVAATAPLTSFLCQHATQPDQTLVISRLLPNTGDLAAGLYGKDTKSKVLVALSTKKVRNLAFKFEAKGNREGGGLLWAEFWDLSRIVYYRFGGAVVGQAFRSATAAEPEGQPAGGEGDLVSTSAAQEPTRELVAEEGADEKNDSNVKVSDDDALASGEQQDQQQDQDDKASASSGAAVGSAPVGKKKKGD